MSRGLSWILALILAGFTTAVWLALRLAAPPRHLAVAPRPAAVPPAGHIAPGTSRPTLLLDVGHSGPIACLAFSPDGRTLATGSYDHTARLWDVASGALIATLQGHTDRLRALAFSPDGKTLATGGIFDNVPAFGTRPPGRSKPPSGAREAVCGRWPSRRTAERLPPLVLTRLCASGTWPPGRSEPPPIPPR